MIHPATEEISNYFTMREIKHRIDEAGEVSYVEAGFNGKVVKNVMVRFFSRTDANDIAVRVTGFGGLTVPEERRTELLVLLNTLNCKFRFVKFCLTADGSINVEYDIGMSATLDVLGEMCREAFIRMIGILDEAYPQIMKTLWSD